MDLIYSIFNSYGWPGLFAITIFGVVFLIFKHFTSNVSSNVTTSIDKIADKMAANINEMSKTLVETQSKQTDKLVDYLIKSKDKEKIEHNGKLDERMTMSNDINQKLKDMLYLNNAQRAMIWEFHNSFQNLSGIPFAKYSCTYEWFMQGIIGLSTKIKSIPFSSLSSVVTDILNNDERQIIYKDLEEFGSKCPVLYDIFHNNGTKALIFNAMYDNKNSIIGVLVMEYHSDIPDNLNFNELKIDTAQITSILNLRYKYN